MRWVVCLSWWLFTFINKLLSCSINICAHSGENCCVESAITQSIRHSISPIVLCDVQEIRARAKSSLHVPQMGLH